MTIRDINRGEKFGLWTVIEAANDPRKGTYYKSVCSCGSERNVVKTALLSGASKSCGCVNRRKKHGLYNHPLYGRWSNMNDRCYVKAHKSYHHYGARGITVCDRWRYDPTLFIKDNESLFSWGLQIDRIDNNGNYTPENTRWCDSKKNQRNRRSNNILTVNGESKTMIEWAEQMHIKPATLHHRIEIYGWSHDNAVLTPVRSWKSRV